MWAERDFSKGDEVELCELDLVCSDVVKWVWVRGVVRRCVEEECGEVQ